MEQFSPKSSGAERECLRTAFESFKQKIGVFEKNIDGANGNASLWLVNGHLYLYRDGLVWATGRPIEDSVNRKFQGTFAAHPP